MPEPMAKTPSPLQRMFHPKKRIRYEGPEEIEAKVRHQVPTLMKKAEGDEPQPPPNYRPAPGQVNKCASCKHFEGATGTCTKYHTPVEPLFVCDAWEGDQQQATFTAPPLPPPPDFSQLTAPGASPEAAMVHEACDRLRKQAQDRQVKPLPYEVGADPETTKAAAILAALEGPDPVSELARIL